MYENSMNHISLSRHVRRMLDCLRALRHMLTLHETCIITPWYSVVKWTMNIDHHRKSSIADFWIRFAFSPAFSQVWSPCKVTRNVHVPLSQNIGLTLENTAAEMAKNGENPTSSSVSLHSLTKPITNPPMKTLIHWMKRDILSPMPSWIFSMSLHHMGKINAWLLLHSGQMVTIDYAIIHPLVSRGNHFCEPL